MNPRARFLVGGGVTVLILALVIFGLWAFTAPSNKPSTPPTITLSPQQQAQKAYDEGVSALSKDQTGTAIALFEKALTLDPNNASAKAALDRAKNSSSNSGSSTTGSSTTKTPPKKKTPAPVSAWDKKIDVKTLVPTSFPDYSLARVESGAVGDADISGTPSKNGTGITTVVWHVRDYVTDAKAAQFLTLTTKKLYPNDGAQVVVNGANAYFADDGNVLASVEYTRGRYVFEVIVTAHNPGTIKDFAVQAASAFPTQP